MNDTLLTIAFFVLLGVIAFFYGSVTGAIRLKRSVPFPRAMRYVAISSAVISFIFTLCAFVIPAYFTTQLLESYQHTPYIYRYSDGWIFAGDWLLQFILVFCVFSVPQAIGVWLKYRNQPAEAAAAGQQAV